MRNPLLDYLRLGVLCPVPAGQVASAPPVFGLLRLMNNVNLYSEVGANAPITTSGTNINLTAAQFIQGITRMTTGASGGFTITMPATSAIVSAMGPADCIAIDGTFAFPVSMMNDNIGQTGTLTAGDASTTLTGTMTVATNTRRLFLVTVTGQGTITVNNIGTVNL